MGGGDTPHKSPPIAGDGGAEVGGRTSDPADKCARVDELTDLLSPKADVLATVQRGDVLLLGIKKGAPPVFVTTKKGGTVGSVVPLALETIVDCLKKGRGFEAEVISLAGGACKLHIRPKRG
jgi:hypothetical protein